MGLSHQLSELGVQDCCPSSPYGALMPARALAVRERLGQPALLAVAPLAGGGAGVPACDIARRGSRAPRPFAIEAGLDTGRVPARRHGGASSDHGGRTAGPSGQAGPRCDGHEDA